MLPRFDREEDPNLQASQIGGVVAREALVAALTAGTASVVRNGAGRAGGILVTRLAPPQGLPCAVGTAAKIGGTGAKLYFACDAFGYTGRTLDGATGLYAYRARWYGPGTGTFYSADPLGFAAGDPNLYRYVSNAPTNATDPSGLDRVTVDGTQVIYRSGWRIWQTKVLIETARKGYDGDTWVDHDGKWIPVRILREVASRYDLSNNPNPQFFQNVFWPEAIARWDAVKPPPTTDKTFPRPQLPVAGQKPTPTLAGDSLVKRPSPSATDSPGGYQRGAATGLVIGSARDFLKPPAITRAMVLRAGPYGVVVGGALYVGYLTRELYCAVGELDAAEELGRELDRQLRTRTKPEPKPEPKDPPIGIDIGDRDKDKSKACFAAGTPLLTPDGWRNVEDLRPGDYLLSRDEANLAGAVCPKIVEDVFVRSGAVWHLHIGGRVIRTAAEHPFFAFGKGWVACNELAVGDLIATQSDGWVRVDELVDTGLWETLYNCRVADYHTYFVGDDQWGFSVWAHNACVTLYHEGSGNYPEQMRHWAIYVESKAGNLYGDMGNTKGNEPQGKDRMKLQAWIDWGDDNKIKAWFRTFPGPKYGMIASKPMEITEEVAAKAIQKMKDMEKATAGKVRWSLDGNSCFEFVAQVLRVAKPDLGLPGPPNGSEERREALLEALKKVMNES